MARRNQYQEKNNPFLTLLYGAVVLALIIAMAFMYLNNRQRRSEYDRLVQEAALSETSYDIESRKGAIMEEPEEEAAEPQAENIIELPTITTEPFIPQNDLVDDTLAEGISD